MATSADSSYNLTNIVAKLKAEPVCLEQLAKLSGVRYNPRNKFPAAHLKLNNGTCTIFRTGTITFTGFKTTKTILRAISELEQKLGDLFKAIDETPTVVNMACTFKIFGMPPSLNLHSLSTHFNHKHPRSAIYEPDCWNALQLYFKGSCRIILHHTASGILTGVKSEAEILDAIEHISDCIDEYLMIEYLKQ